MKSKKLTIMGVFAFLMALMLNFSNSINDYGVKENKLHVEVLAESTTSNGGSNAWYDWLTQGFTKDEISYEVDCTWEYWIGIPGIYGEKESGNGKKIMCKKGGSENCSTGSCIAI